ncbi:Na(+)/H(+) antiporter subunit F1 [Paenibacillus abyssi]|uniref:Na(+)/H(+) antiporter subunit F n=1 Tax=Paenibacillus abyssi TaxID=1340531 RepID=A0A917LFQ2_9BACL|nr:Na(+)/H(+) antiporter subunit F1 [Paenibacillus abyssi]GGG20058.1 Na(+)/H(+) antiporter subunit F [Paenibacillus abyssi]
MLDAILLTSLIILALSSLGCAYRVLVGPSMPDRVIALDTIGMNLIGIVAILSMIQRTQAYLEVILLIGILAFLGTVAFSKYIQKGVVIENGTDTNNDR